MIFTFFKFFSYHSKKKLPFFTKVFQNFMPARAGGGARNGFIFSKTLTKHLKINHFDITTSYNYIIYTIIYITFSYI